MATALLSPTTSRRPHHGDHTDASIVLGDGLPEASYPRCPVCGSYEVSRHSEMGRVWFSCRRCGISF
jgi:hypothetical protein